MDRQTQNPQSTFTGSRAYSLASESDVQPLIIYITFP
jgi:hypothetical protein